MQEGLLHDQRLKTALISKGISGEPVYHLTQRIFEKLALTGDLLDFGAGTGNVAARRVPDALHGLEVNLYPALHRLGEEITLAHRAMR